MKLQSLSSNNSVILIEAHAKIPMCAYIVAVSVTFWNCHK